jgi:hypothetical protein
MLLTNYAEEKVTGDDMEGSATVHTFTPSSLSYFIAIDKKESNFIHLVYFVS